MTIPNMLTLARIALIPVFVWVFYLPFESAHTASALIFLLAAMTDWLDGYLARRWQQTSAFGAFLDPVADKLMVTTTLILLVANYTQLGLVVCAIIIISRELTISALREWMAGIGQRDVVAVSWLGKVKTTVQMLALLLLLLDMNMGGIPSLMLGLPLLYLAAGLTLWSMVTYLRAAFAVLK